MPLENSTEQNRKQRQEIHHSGGYLWRRKLREWVSEDTQGLLLYV